jgi:rubrerythrin
MAESFNIDRFMEGSGKIDLSDIDWAEVPKYPLTPEAVRTIRYFLTTEGSTFFYTKALMKTNTANREPDFAPFLCVWTYEEEFHGRAFRKFLEAYGETIPHDYRKDNFQSRTRGERIDEVGQSLLSHIFPDAWPAVHMVWGTIQEFTTYAAYQALIDRVDHPVLNVLCQRIMKQELRHYAFYREHAKRRLASSLTTQQVVTYALKAAWTPVGDGMSPKEEVVHAIRFLFDGLDGPAIERIERKVRELPGLEWFDLFSRFVAHHNIRKAPASWMSKRSATPIQTGAAELRPG